jgi:hypothetical protein
MHEGARVIAHTCHTHEILIIEFNIHRHAALKNDSVKKVIYMATCVNVMHSKWNKSMHRGQSGTNTEEVKDDEIGRSAHKVNVHHQKLDATAGRYKRLHSIHRTEID